LKRGLECAAIRLKLQSDTFFDKKNGIRLRQDFSVVTINGCDIHVEGVVQSVAVMTLGFLAFNLEHTNVSYRDVLELLECLVGVRKASKASKQKIRALLTSL